MTGLGRTTTNSVGGAKGTITLRNVYVLPAPAGASTQVVSAFFNSGAEKDEIIKVSSSAAMSGQPPSAPMLQPGGSNIYFADGSAPTLRNLKTGLRAGDAVDVTFTFAKAGTITLQVPVECLPQGAASAPGTELATPPPTAGGDACRDEASPAGSDLLTHSAH